MQRTFTNTLERNDYLKEFEQSFFLNELPLTYYSTTHNSAKQVVDVVISIFVLTFLFSWIYPLLYVLIKMESKGPVFFRQLRHGKDNVPFYCLKFRTMVINNEADSRQASRNDPRVTKIGAFLRKSSLDELPQILNVLRGEMSIVGPRPHPLMLNERFSKEISNLMCRHLVKPGITGLAQAKGFRGETSTYYDMSSRCRLDLFYVRNWSFWLDTKIIIWTIFALVRNRNNVY
ncbi:MAG TPA: sugar transferase [Lunatimonas sp.]|nr:sugar transferase [Lunatimonas sp.]